MNLMISKDSKIFNENSLLNYGKEILLFVYFKLLSKHQRNHILKEQNQQNRSCDIQ
jgi:hypothetical protein